jgi:hypothetical protein
MQKMGKKWAKNSLNVPFVKLFSKFLFQYFLGIFYAFLFQTFNQRLNGWFATFFCLKMAKTPND